MPNRKYFNVEDFIFSQKRDQQLILEHLRNIILTNVPHVQESIKWNCPFYTIGAGNICYLNPRKRRVDIGFMDGALLPNSSQLLVGNGKLVRHIQVASLIEINEPSIVQTLIEAIDYRERKAKEKKETN